MDQFRFAVAARFDWLAAMIQWRRWLWVAVVVYGLLLCLWQIQQPIAWQPQLDARENLAWAHRIASGEFGSEPFYRAMLYPAFLSLFLLIGLSGTWLPVAAMLSGAVFHLGATALLERLAVRLWADERAGLMVLVLYGLNPVLWYFALEPLDMAIAILLFVGAMERLTAQNRSFATIIFSGALLGLAVLARPHFLPVVVVLPVLVWLLSNNKVDVRQLAAPWLGAVMILLAMGGINHAVSGEFRILPWQGAYNLYAANREGANGKYYKQKVFLTEVAPDQNPARLESEYSFIQSTGINRDWSIAEFNSYWQARYFADWREQPARMLGLHGRKVYFLFNNFEQYNNKTFSFHKQRNPALRFNPLGWGAVLLCAIGAGWWLVMFHPRRAAAILLIAAVYVAGMLLYYASARFRLPLYSLITLLAAGLPLAWCGIREKLKQRSFSIPVMTAIGLGIGAGLTFSSFFAANSTETFVQDRMLLANAAAQHGNDFEAYFFSKEVLAEHPNRQDALRIGLISFYNIKASGMNFGPTWQDHKEWIVHLNQPAPDLAMVAAVYLWHLGARQDAVNWWKLVVESEHDVGQNAAVLLFLTGNWDSSDPTTEISQKHKESLLRVLQQSF